MVHLEDTALHTGPSPLYTRPKVADEQEQQDREIGLAGAAGHQPQDIHGNAVSTGTPDGATVQPRTKSSVASSLAVLSMYGRAVGRSLMPARDREGGVVTRTEGLGRLSSGVYDQRGDGHEKRKQLRLWYVVKSLAVTTALVAAVVLVISPGKVCTIFISS